MKDILKITLGILLGFLAIALIKAAIITLMVM